VNVAPGKILDFWVPMATPSVEV